MKLYLSSYRIPTPTDLYLLLAKAPEAVRMAIIPNAKDYKNPAEYQESMEETAAYMHRLKFQTEVIDLRRFDFARTLKEALSGYDVIWVCGGNTFLLRWQMRRSGFDQIIRELLDAGTVYAGESAGAIVMGTSLRGIQDADDPTIAEQLIWEGLGVVPKMIIPHADSPEYSRAMATVRQLHPAGDSIVLNDNQALVQNGPNSGLVTA